MKNSILRWWYRITKKTPADMPMVKYWRFKQSVEAKVTHDAHGGLIMKMVGEDQPFPGFPRGYLLFGKLSKLKHEIKNQVFNEAWKKIEEKVSEQEVIREIKGPILDRIFELTEETKYDQVPYERMYLSVKEIYRAWAKVATSERSLKVRDLVTFILQEDDGYRFRVQWLVTYWKRWLWNKWVEQFGTALAWLEKAEVVGDMKERQRLLKRILLLVLQDKSIKNQFIAFCKELNWKKLRLSEADKYHFRGKYFKVDMDLFDY